MRVVVLIGLGLAGLVLCLILLESPERMSTVVDGSAGMSAEQPRDDSFPLESGSSLSTVPGHSVSGSLGSREQVEARPDEGSMSGQGSSFTVFGRVILEGEPERTDETRVIVGAGVDSVIDTLGVSYVSEAWEWGPVEVPLSSSSFLVRLEGGYVVPTQMRLDAPEPGAEIEIELVGRDDASMWFKVVDDAGEPLSYAKVTVSWLDDGYDNSVSGETRTGGFVNVAGVVRGTVDAVATAPGYAPARMGPYVNPPAESEILLLVLQRTGRVRGSVVRAGKPVNDFVVWVWPTSRPGDYSRTSFVDARNGEFQIDAPRGSVTLTATTQDAPPARQVVVDVSATTEVAEVLLDVPSPITGYGIVVDGVSGDPVPGAELQPWLTQGQSQVARYGEPVHAASDGAFELPMLCENALKVQVHAPGYSTSHRMVSASSNGEDLGVVALTPAGSLTIAIKTPLGDSAQRYRIEGFNIPEIPLSRFSTEGRAVFDAVGATDGLLRLSYPDRSIAYVDFVLAAGESPWQLVIDVSYAASLRVSLDIPDGLKLPDLLYVTTSYVDPGSGLSFTRSTPVSDRSAPSIVSAVPPGQFEIDIYDQSNVRYGGTRGLISQDQQLDVLVPLGPFGTLAFTDRSGEPIIGAIVVVVTDDGRRVEDRTDASGVATIGGIREGSATVFVHSESVGTSRPHTVDLSTRGVAVPVSIDPAYSFDVTLSDGSLPVMGAECTLTQSGLAESLPAKQDSNQTGKVRWPRVEAGKYLFRAKKVGFWPVEGEFDGSKGPVDIQFRRRGGLRVQVQGSSSPAGARLSLTSLDTEGDVQEWVSQGLVETASGLVADASGFIEVDGLPNGRYDWSVVGVDGSQASGRVEVPGGEFETLFVGLP